MLEQVKNVILSWDFWQLLMTGTIPLALHSYAKITTTMNAINELRSKSALIWIGISGLSKEFDQLDEKDRHNIMNYLNEYDHFCTLFNERLISRSLVKKTRKTTILNAYFTHKEFIKRWREEYDNLAWKNLELCVNKLKDR